MSPFEIGIILHYYVRGDDHPRLPDIQQTISEMVGNGLLEDETPSVNGPKYRLTEKGDVYAVALTRVPMPEQRWVMPEGA